MKREIISGAVGSINSRYIQEAANYFDQPREKRRRSHAVLSVRRLIALAAVIALCFAAAVPALAANNASAYELLYAISPGLAQKLKPVQLSCESDGIRMEVISSDIEGDMAYVYVSLQDLTGDRLDETTDLFDSYSINRPFDSSAGCENVSFDAETKTATFLITITQFGGEEITGGKITFTVDRILSQKQKFEGTLSEADLSQAELAPLTQTAVDVRGYGGMSAPFEQFLSPAPAALCTPVDGVAVTAVGYIGGKLHVQIHYDDILRTDDHGFVYLLDSGGDAISCDASVSFWDVEHTGSYQEYVFDLSPDEVSGCALAGEFWTCGTLTEGNWQVTFSL